MLTAKTSEENLLTKLHTGADNYLTNPSARRRSIVHRGHPAPFPAMRGSSIQVTTNLPPHAVKYIGEGDTSA